MKNSHNQRNKNTAKAFLGSKLLSYHNSHFYLFLKLLQNEVPVSSPTPNY